MLTTYLIAFGAGAGLLLVSLLAGKDFDAHGDVDHDGPALGHGAGASVLHYFPLLSLSFWTFFAAFFGLTGAALTFLRAAPAVIVVVLAIVIGLATGSAASAILRRLRRHSVGSVVQPADYLGALAHVVVPISGGRRGKVRVDVKGRSLELIAEADAGDSLAEHQVVMIHELLPDGTVRVVSAEDKRAKTARAGEG